MMLSASLLLSTITRFKQRYTKYILADELRDKKPLTRNLESEQTCPNLLRNHCAYFQVTSPAHVAWCSGSILLIIF